MKRGSALRLCVFAGDIFFVKLMSKRSIKPDPKRTVTPVARPVLQRKCACGNQAVGGGECAECQKKNHELQRKAVDANERGGAIPPVVHEVLNSTGEPLSESTRAFMEPRFGHDFSGVRVHTDARAAESAEAVNAHAFTVGQDVVFAPGQYQPSTDAGNALIAHELSHVLQQEGTSGQSVQAISHPGDSSEREADSVAGSVLRSEPVAVTEHASATVQALSVEQGLGIAGGAVALGGIGVGIAALAGAFDKEDFSLTELDGYLMSLKKNKRIEDKRDSDNKARNVVKRGMYKGTDLFLRILLIEEMLSGFAGDDDEDAILVILTDATPKERQTIAEKIGYARLHHKFDGEQLDALYALYPEFNSLYPRGPEKRSTHSIDEFIDMWEKQHGHVMTPEEKKTLGRGCVGITAVNMEDLKNPDLSNCYDTFAEVWAKANTVNAFLEEKFPDKKAFIFSKRFWAGNQKYKPDPKTGRVDLSEHHNKPRPRVGDYDPINFDYGLYDEKTGNWWHANHCDFPLSGSVSCGEAFGMDRMEAYESNLQSYSHPLVDFDRQVFCWVVGKR
jgi:hypothetical protein